MFDEYARRRWHVGLDKFALVVKNDRFTVEFIVHRFRLFIDRIAWRSLRRGEHWIFRVVRFNRLWHHGAVRRQMHRQHTSQQATWSNDDILVNKEGVTPCGRVWSSRDVDVDVVIFCENENEYKIKFKLSLYRYLPVPYRIPYINIFYILILYNTGNIYLVNI